MSKMGKYCKAYSLEKLEEFPGWKEKARDFDLKNQGANDESVSEAESSRPSFLYLQENFIVTEGIFLDEKVVLDEPTPEWISFCKEALKFEVPDYAARSPNTSTELSKYSPAARF
jgi:hypothetical protein